MNKIEASARAHCGECLRLRPQTAWKLEAENMFDGVRRRRSSLETCNATVPTSLPISRREQYSRQQVITRRCRAECAAKMNSGGTPPAKTLSQQHTQSNIIESLRRRHSLTHRLRAAQYVIYLIITEPLSGDG